MNVISEYFRRRREKQDSEMRAINNNLMEDGYLCPNYEHHEYKLLDWENEVRSMVCKKCGAKKAAMARVPR